MSVKIGMAVLDTNSMSCQEMDHLIHELREVRDHKRKAQYFKTELANLISKMRENQMIFCDRDTGAEFQIKDWVIYDDAQFCIHGDEVD